MFRAGSSGCSSLCHALLASAIPTGGTYTILLWQAVEQRLPIGRLGCYDFPRGYYAYTGSAKRNLTSRLHRHIHGASTRHWHIDYLRPYVTVLDWQAYAEGLQPECQLNQFLMAAGHIVAPRFGASDCHCASHLLHFNPGHRPPWKLTATG